MVVDKLWCCSLENNLGGTSLDVDSYGQQVAYFDADDGFSTSRWRPIEGPVVAIRASSRCQVVLSPAGAVEEGHGGGPLY